MIRTNMNTVVVGRQTEHPYPEVVREGFKKVVTYLI
jgi:hypothetical protein